MKALFLIILLSFSISLFPKKWYHFCPFDGATPSEISEMKKKHPKLEFHELFDKVINKKVKRYMRKLGLLKKRGKK